MAFATTAQANTISFGTPTNNSSGSLAGNGDDRSCTNSATVNNGANDSTANAAIVAQASADYWITTNPTAIADITVSYVIPYTVNAHLELDSGSDPAVGDPEPDDHAEPEPFG